MNRNEMETYLWGVAKKQFPGNRGKQRQFVQERLNLYDKENPRPHMPYGKPTDKGWL